MWDNSWREARLTSACPRCKQQLRAVLCNCCSWPLTSDEKQMCQNQRQNCEEIDSALVVYNNILASVYVSCCNFVHICLDRKMMHSFFLQCFFPVLCQLNRISNNHLISLPHFQSIYHWLTSSHSSFALTFLPFLFSCWVILSSVLALLRCSWLFTAIFNFCLFIHWITRLPFWTGVEICGGFYLLSIA